MPIQRNKSSFHILPKKSEIIDGYLGVSPALFVIFGFIAFPFIWAILMSFTDKIVGSKNYNFVGLKNYFDLLFEDRIFWRCLTNTIIYTIVSVPLKVILGIIMALVLNQPIKGRAVFRGLLLLPWVIPTMITAYTWQWMLDGTSSGAINILLKGLGLIKTNISWLSDPKIAMLTVILINAWRGFPFIGITVLAGLQGIPADLYEAAAVDGASSWRKFWNITLPSLRNVLYISTLLTTIWTLNDFELVWILTKGGPMHRTKLISTLTYEYGFAAQKLGLATTVSIITFPLSLFLMIFTFQSILRSEEAGL